MSDRRGPVAPAALALALFAAVGAAVVDHYGVSQDEDTQRAIGQAAVNLVLPGAGDLPADRLLADPRYGAVLEATDRYYGAAFEAPLLLAERLLGLTDSRAVLLSRHLLTHLFFLTGGLFCYLLIYRLFGDRWLALFALLLFLLQPRLYAHSFFNSKDLPFLAMFMLVLYLVQRAFRRDTVAAFALCGAGVGVLVNLRIMGLALFAAVPALLALDLAQARGWPARRRALAAAAAFALAAAGTLYALSPWLWRDPLAFADAVTTLARYPNRVATLFQGERVRWPFIPAHYLPTWMAITTPPATLLLGLTGAAAVLGRGLARPRRALGNNAERFGLLLLACLALPAAAVMARRSNLYDGWRQMYFLYAPLCLLAVYGLRWLLTAAGGAGRAAARLWLRRGLSVLAAAALAGMAAAVVLLHPHQQTYFNFLVDRRTPERLKTQYDLLYWGTEHREGLEHLLARFPGAALHVDGGNRRQLWRNRLILPAAARRRIVIAEDAGPAPDFFILRKFRDTPFGPVLHARRIYHNTVLAVTAVDLALVDQATADRYRATYRATVAGEPLLRSQFDLYLETRGGRTLTWVKESCRPEDTAHRFRLRAAPVAVADLPLIHREEGWEPLGFPFARNGVRFDGRCLIRRSLPDYPIRALEVGRWLPEARNLPVVEAVVDLTAAAPAAGRHWPAHEAIAAGERGAPAASAVFDLYLERGADGAVLTYHKEPCAAEDLRARFFLHLFPAGQAGFDNRDFDFPEHGVLLGGACVALVTLPGYDRGIDRIRTGQFISGQGQLWQAEITVR